MVTIREWVVRLWGTLRPRRRDGDLEEELRVHLELAAEDERRRANSSEDARRAAPIRSAGMAQAMEALRDQRGLPWLDDLARDLRYGFRALRRNPLFASVAVLTLALGIGANTAIFSMADAVLFRTLPVTNPRELVVLRQRGPAESSAARPPVTLELDAGAQGLNELRREFSLPLHILMAARGKPCHCTLAPSRHQRTTACTYQLSALHGKADPES